MKKYVMFYIYSLVSVILLNGIDCHGYREKAHRAINSNIVNQKIASGSLKGYFAVQLGYSSVRSVVNNKPIDEWFEEAGAQEDKPAIRTVHHFLDPISNGAIVGFFDPTAVWAQKEAGKQYPGGSYSWRDAREYFFSALTSNTGDVREAYLAESFRALGQVMHLVADMSVPEHTRDNSHITISTIEKWAEEAFDKNTPEPFFKNYSSRLTRALNNPVPPDPSLLRQPGKFPGAPIPIANLYDFELYTKGSSPDNTITQPIGLAEFTNANFFSRDTIFKDYDYPAESSVQLYEEWDDESGKPMKFIRKIKDGEPVEHLAQTKVFYKYLLFKTNGYTIVNDKVYADYLEKLIPRAVGYAGALVDYFYRGRIDLTFNPTDVTFRSIKVTAQNATGEEMGLGDIALVIRYKTLPETDLGGGKYLLEYPRDYPPEGTSNSNYTYKVINLSTQADLKSAKELTFDLSGDPLPIHFDDMTMQLVYKGPLGSETGAVAVSELKTVDGIYSDFDISLPPSGVYAKVSGDSLDGAFNELRLTATTDIPGGLNDGSIMLFLEHTVSRNDPYQSVAVDTAPAGAAGYLIKVPVSNGVTSLAQGVPTELVFNLSSAPLPVKAADVHLGVVYLKPDGTPMAIGFHDISEPTPVDLFNNTDYSCVAGNWYPSGTSGARAAADQAGNGNGLDDDMDTYPHDFTNILSKSSSTATPIKASPTVFDFFEPGPIAPDTMKRLGYVLTDYSFAYSFYKTWVHTSAPQDGWTTVSTPATQHSGTGFTNQGDRGFGAMYSIRGRKMWWGAGEIMDNLKTLQGSSCDWSALE